MIKYFKKFEDQPNFLEFLWIFIRVELIELLTILGFYNAELAEYDYRKIFWFFTCVGIILIFISIVSVASLTYIVHIL